MRDFIGDLDAKRRAVLLNQLGRLNELSDTQPHLPFPHSSQIVGELRELRCHVGSELYRVLYRRSAGLIMLLHVFRTKTGRGPAHGNRDRAGALGRLQGEDGRRAPPTAATGRPRRALRVLAPLLTLLTL